MRNPLLSPLAAVCCLAPLGTVAHAQAMITPVSAAKARGRPSITWCGDAPVEKYPKWKRQTVDLLLIAEPSGDAAAPQPSPLKPYVGMLLSGIVRSYVAVHGGVIDGKPGAALPEGDARYLPTALGTRVRFDVMGDGRIDSIRVAPGSDSLFAADLVAAIHAAAQGAETFGPYGSETMRTTLVLEGTPQGRSGGALWPAFTIDAPVMRMARAHSENQPPAYPDGILTATRFWHGKMEYRFAVDRDGAVDRATITNLKPPDNVLWTQEGQEAAYRAFMRAIENAIPHWRFEPAAFLGCNLRQEVTAPFDFTNKR